MCIRDSHNSSGVDGGLSYLKGTEIYIANNKELELAEKFMEELNISLIHI